MHSTQLTQLRDSTAEKRDSFCIQAMPETSSFSVTMTDAAIKFHHCALASCNDMGLQYTEGLSLLLSSAIAAGWSCHPLTAHNAGTGCSSALLRATCACLSKVHVSYIGTILEQSAFVLYRHQVHVSYIGTILEQSACVLYRHHSGGVLRLQGDCGWQGGPCSHAPHHRGPCCSWCRHSDCSSGKVSLE